MTLRQWIDNGGTQMEKVKVTFLGNTVYSGAILGLTDIGQKWMDYEVISDSFTCGVGYVVTLGSIR